MYLEMSKLKFMLSRMGILLPMLVLLASCASNKLDKITKANSVKSTYYIWHTGVAPSGTGLNCEISFFNPEMTITVDSLEVNDKWYDTEMEQKGDTTVIIGRYYVGPNFENPESGVPKYFLSEKYSGRIKLNSKEESLWVEIEEFKKTLNRQMPL